MTTVDIHISTNTTEKERKNLYISEEAIRNFTGEGFQSNLYQGRILFESMPIENYYKTMMKKGRNSITWKYKIN